jgi:hypothetical protein
MGELSGILLRQHSTRLWTYTIANSDFACDSYTHSNINPSPNADVDSTSHTNACTNIHPDPHSNNNAPVQWDRLLRCAR